MTDLHRKSKRILGRNNVKSCFRMMRTICGPLRFKIVVVLHIHQDGWSVSELAELLEVSVSRVSQELRILRLARLVTTRRVRRRIIYRLKAGTLHKHFQLRCLE